MQAEQEPQPAERADEDAQAPAPGAAAVVVRLGGCRYALAMEAVAEVARVPDLTRVPGVPGWVAGVANVRGRVLPVLDLRPVLDAPAHAMGSASRLVVLHVQGVDVGLLTEAVEGTLELPAGPPTAAPGTLAAGAAELVQGQLSEPRGPVALLDTVAVLALRERLSRGRRAA